MFLMGSCSNEKWSCYIDGTDMWSLSNSGMIGPANYGCTCQQIRNHALQNWGYVDEVVMRKEFNCYF